MGPIPHAVMTPLASIHPNPDNPRVIKDKQFKSLCKSLKEFPQMLTIRPLVTTADGTIIGGNQRYEAAKSIGMTEIPVLCADSLTPEQVKRFIISDNMPYGSWDMDALANGWDMEELLDWGFEAPGVPDMGAGLPGDSDGGGTETVVCPKCGHEFTPKGGA